MEIFIEMRNQEILRLRSKNNTLANIGNKFNLSRERIRQILKTTKPEKEYIYLCDVIENYDKQILDLQQRKKTLEEALKLLIE